MLKLEKREQQKARTLSVVEVHGLSKFIDDFLAHQLLC